MTIKNYNLIHADNVTAMQNIEANTFDSCITDPPYGMAIAGVGWDHNVPPVATWQEVYRVLKPGGFVASFCSPEFYHRMAINVEDAGFLPKDMVVWMVTTKMAKKNRLKPAHEPIFIAQKPLEKSIKHNVSEWGCGEINTTTTRVPWDGAPPTGWIAGGEKRRAFGSEVNKASESGEKNKTVDANPSGRYPSDIIGHFDEPEHQKYFYAPRVTRKERGEYNNHPTPKPINLMRYLIRIYTPAGGKVLDPFVGSGSTGIAALQENCEFTGIDTDEAYIKISEQRILDHCGQPADVLFDYETK